MPTYIALLRGINIGGHKVVKMEQLRKAFEAIGFENVRTYIQSGNVIFESSKRSPEILSKAIGELMVNNFGFAVATVVKTSEEMGCIIRKNPFANEDGVDVARSAVIFLPSSPATDAVTRLGMMVSGAERLQHSGREIYLYLPDGYQTKLASADFTRVLSVSATVRNWNSVNKLYAMSLERQV